MSRAEPIALPAGKTEAAYLRFRRAQCQKVARARRDDPSFDWLGFGRACANDLMYLPSGRYVTPGGGLLSWGSPNAKAILLYGKNAPFEALEDVPAHVLEAVEAGVADALAVGAHVIYDGLDIGRRLGLSDEMRRALRVWLLWPAGMSRAEFEARHDGKRSRAAAMREKRRAAGVRPREQYEAESVAAIAREMGEKPDTLRARLRRRAPVASHVASVFQDNISKEYLSGHRPATKRDTIARQARAMGLKPDTLRARLRREAMRAGRAEPSGARPATMAAGAESLSAANEAATLPSVALTGSPAKSGTRLIVLPELPEEIASIAPTIEEITMDNAAKFHVVEGGGAPFRAPRFTPESLATFALCNEFYIGNSKLPDAAARLNEVIDCMAEEYGEEATAEALKDEGALVARLFGARGCERLQMWDGRPFPAFPLRLVG